MCYHATKQGDRSEGQVCQSAPCPREIPFHPRHHCHHHAYHHRQNHNARFHSRHHPRHHPRHHCHHHDPHHHHHNLWVKNLVKLLYQERLKTQSRKCELGNPRVSQSHHDHYQRVSHFYHDYCQRQSQEDWKGPQARSQGAESRFWSNIFIITISAIFIILKSILSMQQRSNVLLQNIQSNWKLSLWHI